MKILVLGSGLMGPAGAYNAISDPAVELVSIADLDSRKLDDAYRHLSTFPGSEKLSIRALDLADEGTATEYFRGFDAILSALPWSASRYAIAAALGAGVPIVDLAIPDENEFAEWERRATESGGLILLGCGLEPGLTELMSRYLAERLDTVSELHIKVGGIPEVPSGPLGYKIVFGGEKLPLRDIDAMVVEGGESKMLPRYSGVERVHFDGLRETEAWNEGVLPWILDLPEFKSLRECTQKTVRWPGYAERASMLLEMGLLGTRPVAVDGVQVIPKDLVDTLLYPHVRLAEGEGDITLFRVEVGGEKDGVATVWRADMIDRIDRERGFTSMARTTAFTGAIAARMIARGDIKATGLYTCETLITNSLFERIMEELAAEGVHFTITSSQPG